MIGAVANGSGVDVVVDDVDVGVGETDDCELLDESVDADDVGPDEVDDVVTRVSLRVGWRSRWTLAAAAAPRDPPTSAMIRITPTIAPIRIIPTFLLQNGTTGP
jgi:hypothetical protein